MVFFINLEWSSLLLISNSYSSYPFLSWLLCVQDFHITVEPQYPEDLRDSEEQPWWDLFMTRGSFLLATISPIHPLVLRRSLKNYHRMNEWGSRASQPSSSPRSVELSRLHEIRRVTRRPGIGFLLPIIGTACAHRLAWSSVYTASVFSSSLSRPNSWQSGRTRRWFCHRHSWNLESSPTKWTATLITYFGHSSSTIFGVLRSISSFGDIPSPSVLPWCIAPQGSPYHEHITRRREEKGESAPERFRGRWFLRPRYVSIMFD